MDAVERALDAVRDSGLTPLAWEVVTTGWESTIVRVQTSSLDLAAKVYTYHDAATAERELDVMSGLSRAGYPVPRVHGLSITEHSQPALVMGFIEPSQTVALRWSESAIDVLVDAMDQLHHTKLESWTDDPLGWAYVELDEISGTIPELREVATWVRQRLNHLDPIVGPVHMDFHSYNIVVDDAAVFWVVDWTSFQVSDVRLDVHWTRLLWEMFRRTCACRHVLRAHHRSRMRKDRGRPPFVRGGVSVAPTRDFGRHAFFRARASLRRGAPAPGGEGTDAMDSREHRPRHDPPRDEAGATPAMTWRRPSRPGSRGRWVVRTVPHPRGWSSRERRNDRRCLPSANQVALLLVPVDGLTDGLDSRISVPDAKKNLAEVHGNHGFEVEHV